MKTLKRRFIVVVMAFAALIMSVFSVGNITSEKTYALSLNYHGEPDTVYYFTDYYPTLDYTTLSYYLSSYNIIYDHQYVDEQTFTDMVYSGYFYGFGYNCTVIIDIKTFMPDSSVLYYLFYNLQQNQGCNTSFVSTYQDYEYPNTDFMDFVNRFMWDDFSKLEFFIQESVEDLKMKNGSLSNTNILVDGHLVDTANLFGSDMETLCSSSPFLKFLLEFLASYIETFNEDYNDAGYQLSEKSIKLLVHMQGDEYVDILTWTTYTFNDIEEVRCLTDNNEDEEPSLDDSSDTDPPLDDNTEPSFVCGIGFWYLDRDFYNFLFQGQQLISPLNLPVYLLEADPFAYGSGLVIVNLAVGNSDESLLFLEWLLSMLI